jgi:glycosyltransferase involved in cell wall biosynthesis
MITQLSKKKILLIYPYFSTFVEQDFKILSEKYSVDKYHFIQSKNIFIFLYQFLRQFFNLLSRGWKYSAFFIWFADYHSFLPVLFAWIFSKKSLIVVGGYDATAFPLISYGVFQKKNGRYFCAKYSFKMTDYILPVTKSLIKSINTQISPPHKIEIGITHFVKNVEQKIKVIHTGFDVEIWDPKDVIKKKNSVLTVASVNNERTFFIKGLDLYFETARLLPQFTFTVIGLQSNMLVYANKIAPGNVTCLGYIPQDTLIQEFKKSVVYAQFSITEGLPNVVCEAMLAGCIPVGSNVGGIPELIETTGILINERSPEIAKKAILDAYNLFENDNYYGLHCRKFIVEKCSKSKRRNELESILG